MKKVILSLGFIISIVTMSNESYIVKNNSINHNYNIKQVKDCKMIKVNSQVYNIDGTRAICEADGVTYKFRESMINFKELKEGKNYDVEFTGREVQIGETKELSNLYLIDIARPEEVVTPSPKIVLEPIIAEPVIIREVQKVEPKIVEKVVEKEIVIEKTAVLPFSCSITERKCIIRGFKVDGREPNNKEIADLRKIAEVVNQFAQGGHIDFVGHTDSTASNAYNQKLSEDRAYSIARLLRQYGLKDTIGYGAIGGRGEEVPYDTNETVEGRYNNRRVELYFYNVDFSNIKLTNYY